MRRALPLVAAVLLAFVPYRELFTSQVPVARDLAYYFYPLKAHLAEAVLAGQVPWIDRYRWGGVPLLGGPGGSPFDPGNVLFLLLPLGTAMKAWILLRLATTVLGIAYLARGLGLTVEAAAVSGLAFGLSGVSVSLALFPLASSALSVLPWLLGLLIRLEKPPNPRQLAAIAGTTALILLAGMPEIVLHAALLGTLLLVDGRLLSRDGGARRRVLAWVAGAALLGAGLAAPALFASVSTAFASVRGPGGMSGLDFAGADSLPVARLADLLADGSTADWTTVAGTAEILRYPYLPSITPGRLSLALAAVGLAVTGRGRIVAAVLAVVGVLLALGPATPFWPLAARAIPPLQTVRFPEKHLVLSGLAVAWLAALGLRAIESRVRPGLRGALLLLIALAILGDREATSRGLCLTEGPEVLTSPPQVLRGLPLGGPSPLPPRLVCWDALSVPPVYDRSSILAVDRVGRASAFPWYGTLFGAAYAFETDYDASLPRAAAIWTRLVTKAIEQGDAARVRDLMKGTGVSAVARTEKDGEGWYRTRLHLFKEPLSPFRFARRAIVEEDPVRVRSALLGPDALDLAVLSPGRRALELSPEVSEGRVLEMDDRADELRLVVEVTGTKPGILMLYRLREAVEDATLDQHRVETVPMGAGFAAVVVPPGRHQLRLRPDTRWVKLGAVVSAASLLGLLVFLGAVRSSRAPAGSASRDDRSERS